MKKAIWIIVVALIFTLSGCAVTTEPIISESNSSQTVNEEISSGINEVDKSESVVFSGGNDISAESNDTAENKTENHITQEHSTPQIIPETEATQETSVPSSTSAETKPDQTEPPKQSAAQPPKLPVESETTEPIVTEKPVSVVDPFELEAKVAAYISQYRGSNVTMLNGLTKVARYRSQQLVSDFSHSDGIDACNALQYGEYVDMTLYGCPESDNYYQGYNREAIAKGNWNGSADEIAQKIANGFKNSTNHWQYLGSSEYPYIAVGCTYDPATLTWYCCVCISSVNYGE